MKSSNVGGRYSSGVDYTISYKKIGNLRFSNPRDHITLSCTFVNKYQYTVSRKISPDIFSCKSSKHDLTFIIFGKIITERLSNQKLFYFLTSPK